jgi:hypothetical protein
LHPRITNRAQPSSEVQIDLLSAATDAQEWNPLRTRMAHQLAFAAIALGCARRVPEGE